jgi:hypothetical protein
VNTSKFKLSLSSLPRRYREGIDVDQGMNYKFSTGFKFTYTPNLCRDKNGLQLDGFGYFGTHTWDAVDSQCTHEGDNYKSDDCSCCSICEECGIILKGDRL